MTVRKSEVYFSLLGVFSYDELVTAIPAVCCSIIAIDEFDGVFNLLFTSSFGCSKYYQAYCEELSAIHTPYKQGKGMMVQG